MTLSGTNPHSEVLSPYLSFAPNNTTNPQQPQNPPCNPAARMGGVVKAFDGYQTAAMAFTFAGLHAYVGVGAALVGCADPSPFEPATCAGGVFIAGTLGTGAYELEKLGIHIVTHEMIPGIKQSVTCKQ